MRLGSTPGQRLFAIYAVLSPTYVDYYTAWTLACLNCKQFAVKKNTKRQQALGLGGIQVSKDAV